MTTRSVILALALTCFPVAAQADIPEIVGVRAQQQPQGWRFDVTLRHPDSGWTHYADAWEVVAPDGQVLGQRVLLHPHVQEQPFTRSLTGIQIPPEVDTVYLRARCLVDGWGEATTKVSLN